MQDCQVCGRRFDPLGFQVVVPELGRGFDRLECAQSARALAGPGSRIAPAPLLAVVEPITAALAPVGAPAAALRPVSVPVGTLGLLAAGTAAAVFLWLRVLGPDTSSFTLGRLAAPPAFGHETVQAHIQPAPPRPTPAARPSEHRAPDSVTALVAVRPSSAAPHVSGEGQTSAQPSSPSRPARPAPTQPSGPDKATGKGHPKHGKGHYKQGESDGVHSPGHGHKQHGHGKGKKH